MSDKYKSYTINLQMADGKIHQIPFVLPIPDKGERGDKGDKGDKGATGAKIVSTVSIGTDENGGNIYRQTFDNGATATFTVPKGDKGEKGDKGIQGEQGLQGEQGIQGEKGEQGIQGETGEKGEQGLSAYVIARNNGYNGTEQEWLASLKGEKGERGEKGEKGDKGDKGDKGATGAKIVSTVSIGTDENGGNIYRQTFDNGATATFTVPKGDKGEKGDKGIQGEQGLQGEQGIQGAKGDTGATGADGLSAYEIAVKNGFSGTEEEWLNSLKGDGKKEIVVVDIDKMIETQDNAKFIELSQRYIAGEIVIVATLYGRFAIVTGVGDLGNNIYGWSLTSASWLIEEMGSLSDTYIEVFGMTNEKGYIEYGRATYNISEFVREMEVQEYFWDAPNRFTFTDEVKSAWCGMLGAVKKLPAASSPILHLLLENGNIVSQRVSNLNYNNVGAVFRLQGVGETTQEPVGTTVARMPKGDWDCTPKKYVDDLFGDIESALDNIIAIQNSLIGGKS